MQPLDARRFRYRHSYQYDKAGNRTSTQLDGIVTSTSHNIANQITEMEEAENSSSQATPRNLPKIPIGRQ